MPKSDLFRDYRIFILVPVGTLAAPDVSRVGAEIDPFIAESDSLRGG